MPGSDKIRILVVGSGAREHTLVWKLSQSPRLSGLYAAPGNAGTSLLARNLDTNPNDIDGLVKAARENRIELVVVGPEGPLADGIVDRFQKEGIPIFGPTRAAAEIESSKLFAKQLMQKYGIPSARFVSFSDYSKAREYVQKHAVPVVIKADGLAAGKGVIIGCSTSEALEALDRIMRDRAFGAAGNGVVIEECLTGKEVSTFCFTDGANIVPMVAACDYKRVFDDDQGPNTGGMGGYSPPGFFTPALAEKVKEAIMVPSVKAMATEKRPYKGVLYSGLMVTAEGPKVLEFNARFGDPETQVTLPLLKTDLLDIMLAVMNGSLDRTKVEWSQDACVGVVMASGGYPSDYKTGFPITGLNTLDKDILVFHAGTGLDSKGRLVTKGGRVLTVVATGRTVGEARERAYSNLSRIHFQGCHYRGDIAQIDKR